MNKFNHDLQLCEEVLSYIRDRRPKLVIIAEIGVWSKLPYLAIIGSGCLLWRTEELARNAIRALRECDVASAGILCRGVLENAMLHWYLKTTVGKRDSLGEEALRHRLTKIVMGSKVGDSDLSPVQVMTALEELEKTLPIIREVYARLSETAHPNYDGVHALYANTDYKAHETHFGSDLRTDATRKSLAIDLHATLLVQLNAEKALSMEMPAWIKELPSLDSPRPNDGPN